MLISDFCAVSLFLNCIPRVAFKFGVSLVPRGAYIGRGWWLWQHREVQATKPIFPTNKCPDILCAWATGQRIRTCWRSYRSCGSSCRGTQGNLLPSPPRRQRRDLKIFVARNENFCTFQVWAYKNKLTTIICWTNVKRLVDITIEQTLNCQTKSLVKMGISWNSPLFFVPLSKFTTHNFDGNPSTVNTLPWKPETIFIS